MQRDVFSRWRVVAAICAAVGCWTVAPSFAGSVVLTLPTGWISGPAHSGGPFNATVSGLTGYTGPASFPTFCVEDAEFFSPGTSYAAVISDRAMAGDNGGQDSTHSFDMLSAETAFLYQHFRAGDLGSYVSNYHDTLSDRYQLQFAIWHSEGETSTPYGGSANALSKKLYEYAQNLHLSSIGNVRVLQLWSDAAHVGNLEKDSSGNYKYARQDQLILVPLPPAFVAGLGLLGCLGIVAWTGRRNQMSLMLA